MGRQQRRYTPEEIAAALAVLEANGGNVSRTARETGYPRSTLAEWAVSSGPTMPGAETRQGEKKSLRDLYEEHIRAAVGLMASKASEASYRDLSTGVGILDDKLTRADGKPTERLEVMDWRQKAMEEGLDPDDVLAEAHRILGS